MFSIRSGRLALSSGVFGRLESESGREREVIEILAFKVLSSRMMIHSQISPGYAAYTYVYIHRACVRERDS